MLLLVGTDLFEVIILLTLLVSWMDDGITKSDVQVIEYFSGVARISRVASAAGFESVAYDIEYTKPRRFGKRSSMDLNGSAGLALAIKLILHGKFDEVVAIFATCCSTWTPVNRGTGKRSIVLPEGDEQVVSVRKSNKMVSRNLCLGNNGTVNCQQLPMHCWPHGSCSAGRSS